MAQGGSIPGGKATQAGGNSAGGGAASAASPPVVLRELATRALLGTDRSGGAKDAAGALLRRAAAASTRARAGRRSQTQPGEAPECPEDPKPMVSANATSILERLLLEPRQQLIEEWAGLANARGLRVADATAPVLLDWWARQNNRSEVVFAVLGVRGAWLMSLNPAWKKPAAVDVLPSDVDDAWQTGTGPERAALLRAVRRKDAARGLELVRSTWASDGADDKRRFLDALGERLGMGDESFLEGALDDRAKSVRQKASALLAGLAGSRLRARMNERLRALVKVERKKGGILRREAVTIQVEPPAEFDASWDRDGIEEKPPSGAGKRAWWLRQIVGGADPRLWCGESGRESGLSVKDVVEALSEHEYFRDLCSGWFQAVQNSPDPAWIEALTTLYFTKARKGSAPAGWMNPQQLWAALPREQHEEIVLRAIGDESVWPRERFECAGSVTWPWSAAFSVRLVEAFARSTPKLQTDHVYSGGPLEQLAGLLHPASAAAYEAWIRGALPTGERERLELNHLPKVLDLLRLRGEMYKEFEA
jgi:hypothetical protein